MNNYDTVCIIDDDPIYIFGTRRMMKMVNFCKHITEYHNGKEALDGLTATLNTRKHIPEVIFLDLNMPVMDGWEFLDEFTKVPAPEPITIYVVTSSVDPEDVGRIKQYKSVNNYIVKPVSVDKLKLIRKAA